MTKEKITTIFISRISLFFHQIHEPYEYEFLKQLNKITTLSQKKNQKKETYTKIRLNSLISKSE